MDLKTGPAGASAKEVRCITHVVCEYNTQNSGGSESMRFREGA
jgi:hypothetical protein